MRNIIWSICIYFLLFNASKANCQIQSIDSISKLLKNHHYEDTLKATYFQELSFLYRQINPDTSLYLANKSLTLSDSLYYLEGVAWAKVRIASAFWMKANYPEVLRYSYDALNIFEQEKNTSGIAQCLNTIANTHNMEGEHEKSLEFYNRCIEYYEKLNDQYNVNRAYANIGRTYFMLENYSKALDNLKIVIENYKNNQNNILYAIVINTSGDILQAEGKYEKSLKYYFEALRIAEDLQSLRIVTYSTRGISEIYQKLKELGKSNQFALRTLNISNELDYVENYKNAALILSDNHNALRNSGEAYKYYVIYSEAKDRMFNLEKERELTRLQESHQVSQKQKEIQLLKAEQEIQQHENKNQRLIMYSLIIFLLLISIQAVILYKNIRSKKRANQMLTEQNNEIFQQREEILAQSKNLKKSNETKDKLFSIVSHDLRTPFNSLLSLVNLLDSLSTLPLEEVAVLMKKIKVRIKSLSEMVNNLLLWSNLQMRGEESEKKITPINNVISEIYELMKPVAADKEISLIYEPNGNYEILVNVDQIKSVLRNLINNAIKFTNSNGTITINAKSNENDFEVTVKDSGVGISDVVLNSLFSDDSVHTTLGTSREEGSGLGLRICKDFVESNGGKIWAESDLGHGSSFHFTMPKKN